MMAESCHYCKDCDTHFRVSCTEHADEHHSGLFFRGVKDGTHRDYSESDYTFGR